MDLDFLPAHALSAHRSANPSLLQFGRLPTWAILLAALGLGACVDPLGVGKDSVVDDSCTSSTELCDGVDNDCDGSVDEDDSLDAGTWHIDADEDGFGISGPYDTIACEAPSAYVESATDCDDLNGAAYPGANEICDDADNDCDGIVDEDDASDAVTWHIDVDDDGYGETGTYDIAACEQPDGYVAEGSDCDDGDPGAFPGGLEVCDGTDNDCDGVTDGDNAADTATWYADSDRDGFGALGFTYAACEPPDGYVADATDCDDSRPTAFPGAAEECNTYDDDCDGATDEDDAVDASIWYADADGDSFGAAATAMLACVQPSGYLSDSSDCDDGREESYPYAPEYCNSHDDDCDGATDEGDALDASTWYADSDADGFGDPAASANSCAQPAGYLSDGSDCNGADPAVHPGAEENPTDATDSDCDPDTDDLDGDGWSTAFGDCDDTTTLVSPEAAELLNGADDNCNGDIDEEYGGSVAANLQTTAVVGTDYDYADAFEYPLGDGRAYTHASDGDGYYVYTEFHGASAWYSSVTNHMGEDWNGEGGGDQGDALLAVANGIVLESTTGSAGWGQYVVIRHDAPEGGTFVLPDGTTTEIVVTLYAHVQNRLVAEGDAVVIGQTIAEIGPTATGSTAPHLHFEVGWDLSQSYPGYGYSPSTLGRVDPTEFLDGNVTVVGTAALDAPTNVSVVYDSGSLWNYITWDNVAGASDYVVYWSTSSGVDTSDSQLSPTTTLDYGHSGVSAGSTYCYRVAARDAAGTAGALSAEVCETVPTAAGAPDVVVDSVDAWDGGPFSISDGDFVDIDFYMGNLGTVDAGVTGFWVFVSPDPNVTVADVPVNGLFGPLYVGPGSMEAGVYIIRGTAFPASYAGVGTWYVGIIGDPEELIAESDESNNVGVDSVPITIVP